MTPTRVDAIDRLGPTWMLPADGPLTPDALDEAFGRPATRYLDIGVGNGDATRAWAAAHPDVDVVAVELHRPGIAHLLRHLDGDRPTNVRIVDGDITALLPTAPPETFGTIRILFPDPWPKKRHHKRRLVDAGFVHQAADRLLPGGRLHLATDWPDYADAMRAALATEPRLAPVVDHDDGDGAWRTERPDRPVTAYERRGLDAHRPVTDLVALRTAGPR
jgi:tRNA (guanine-N7-)-methyltransferase